MEKTFFLRNECNHIVWKKHLMQTKKCSWIMRNEDDDIVKSNCAYLHSHALSFDVYPIYDDQTKLFFIFSWERPRSHKGSFLFSAVSKALRLQVLIHRNLSRIKYKGPSWSMKLYLFKYKFVRTYSRKD